MDPKQSWTKKASNFNASPGKRANYRSCWIPGHLPASQPAGVRPAGRLAVLTASRSLAAAFLFRSSQCAARHLVSSRHQGRTCSAAGSVAGRFRNRKRVLVLGPHSLTEHMLCSNAALGFWLSRFTAGIRRQPCSVAVALGKVATESSQHFALGRRESFSTFPSVSLCSLAHVEVFKDLLLCSRHVLGLPFVDVSVLRQLASLGFCCCAANFLSRLCCLHACLLSEASVRGSGM